MKSFLFLGGDLRMLFAARYLNRYHSCFIKGFENAPSCFDDLIEAQEVIKYDCAVLPLPASADGETIVSPFSAEPVTFSEILRLVKKGGRVYTPKFFPRLDEVCAEGSLVQLNYFIREELQVMNAVPTAEGAVHIAISELQETVFGSKIVITGLGRIGKVLSRLLCAMGAHVTVATRKLSDCAYARQLGCRGVLLGTDDFLRAIRECTLSFNTVPAPIYSPELLREFRKGAVIIDLASSPCVPEGVDGIKVIRALSLPGKYSPLTSGEIIGQTLENMLLEERL